MEGWTGIELHINSFLGGLCLCFFYRSIYLEHAWKSTSFFSVYQVSQSCAQIRRPPKKAAQGLASLKIISFVHALKKTNRNHKSKLRRDPLPLLNQEQPWLTNEEFSDGKAPSDPFLLLIDICSHSLNNVELPPVVWLALRCQFQRSARPQAGGSSGGSRDLQAISARGCQVKRWRLSFFQG